MKCKDAIDRYIALDNNEAVPFSVTIHLLGCRQCRKIVRAMTSAANLYSKTMTSQDSDNILTQKTMEKVNILVPDLMKIQAEKNSLPEVSFLPWIIIGIIMILGFATIPFTSLGQWAVAIFKVNFIIPFTLVFATFVSVYCALFVGRNLDFFIKKFDLK